MLTHLSQLTLLYAEDDLTVLKQYKDYFENFFKQVYTAVDGQQALDIYNKEKPHVVILDINMPKLNGIEVSKVIRQQNKETVLVLLTAIVDKDMLIQAAELDLCCYLEKPLLREQLKQTLTKISNKLAVEKEINLWQLKGQTYRWQVLEKELYCGKRLVSLTKNEKVLFELLLNSNHCRLSYEQIFTSLWGVNTDKEYNESNIKSLIKDLRAKLPAKVIKNAYGIGYYLEKNIQSK